MYDSSSNINTAMAISNWSPEIVENQNNKLEASNNKNRDNSLMTLSLTPREKLEFNRTLEELFSKLDSDLMDISEPQSNVNSLSISKQSKDVLINTEKSTQTNDMMTNLKPMVNMQLVFKTLYDNSI